MLGLKLNHDSKGGARDVLTIRSSYDEKYICILLKEYALPCEYVARTGETGNK